MKVITFDREIWDYMQFQTECARLGAIDLDTPEYYGVNVILGWNGNGITTHYKPRQSFCNTDMKYWIEYGIHAKRSSHYWRRKRWPYYLYGNSHPWFADRAFGRDERNDTEFIR